MKRISLTLFVYVFTTLLIIGRVASIAAKDSASGYTVPPSVQTHYNGTFRYGDTLERVLLRSRLNRETIQGIISAFQNRYDVTRLKAGNRFSLYSDSTGTLQSFVYHDTPVRSIRVTRDSSNRFIAREHNRPLMTRTRLVEGVIESSLYQAVLEQGETPELIVEFSDIFQWDIDFFIDPRVGDRFKILVEKQYVGSDSSETGQFYRYGRILAGQYIQDDTTYTAIYFDNPPKESGYYDLAGHSFQKTFLKSPLNYRRISSYFTHARRHPILKIVRPHYAVDFAAPSGTPVVAAGDGIIIAKGYNKGLGYYIKIQHKNKRYVTRYGHFKGFARGISKGDSVKQGQVIGYVGSTGLATGPHLDYAFYDNGRPINPLSIKNSSGDPILDKNRDRFDHICQMRTWELMGLSPVPYASNRETP
jgi:murein DD-endopeptidase MepM/ murein hydrolase activator NlpD